ncbi:MAG: S-layer homology domain-containing protein, partial [Oscillospiraceae bacterium]|nr:S-layer homology domain-containing protein [Oscillospiraceae bacterium]
VVTLLWRAAGCPEPTGSSSPFTDVKPGDYYYKAVLWAVEKNITKGTGAATFSPSDGCTRGQVVTFLHRFENTPSAGSASNPFADVSSGAYYNAAVLWAVKNDITTGTSAGKFSPDDVCTRGQIVTFLYRDMVPNANNNSDSPAAADEPADDPGTVTVKGKARYDLVQAVLDSVNRNRADNGLSAFTLSGQLTEMAMLRAAECVVSFSHTRPNGELCFSIDSDGSYTGGYVNAENIANGQRSASDVMTAWMNSEGHRNNILNRNSTQIGIGCFECDGTLYWVQLFGTGSDTTTPGSASVSRDVKVKTAA